MARDYVIAKADSSPILTFPSGIALITIRAGRRYLATDDVVKQHPHLFRPVERPAPATTERAA
jgi:hypothetical protein